MSVSGTSYLTYCNCSLGLSSTTTYSTTASLIAQEHCQQLSRIANFSEQY
jgi:hypothetical protein